MQVAWGRVEHEGGVAVWLVGILAEPSVHRQLTASATGGTALSESVLKPLITGDQKASLASLSPQLCPFSLLELSLAWGPSLLFGVQKHREPSLPPPPWLGSYSVDHHISHLKEHPGWVLLYSSIHQAFDGSAPLLFSCQWWHIGGESYGDGSTQYTWLSSIALLPWLPSFPPQAFPTTISSLTPPQSVSLQSTSALTLGLLHNP